MQNHCLLWTKSSSKIVKFACFLRIKFGVSRFSWGEIQDSQSFQDIPTGLSLTKILMVRPSWLIIQPNELRMSDLRHTKSSEKHQKETGTQILIENVVGTKTSYVGNPHIWIYDVCCMLICIRLYGVHFSCLVHHGSLRPWLITGVFCLAKTIKNRMSYRVFLWKSAWCLEIG